jgi:hypothetical protein
MCRDNFGSHHFKFILDGEPSFQCCVGSVNDAASFTASVKQSMLLSDGQHCQNPLDSTIRDCFS